MMINCNKRRDAVLTCITLPVIFLLVSFSLPAQQQARLAANNSVNNKVQSLAGNDKDLFGINGRYIQNKGQYGDTLVNYTAMGKILYGYEGLRMPVLFTAKGIIHLQRKQEILTYEEKERMEERGMSKEQIRKSNPAIDRVITVEWVNANPAVEIIPEDAAEGYHVYGLQLQKTPAYEKLTYKEIYPGIDAVYSFIKGEKPGYEFSLIVRPGADITKVKMRYGGDVKSIRQDKNGQLIISSDIEGIIQSAPLCFYPGDGNSSEKTRTGYAISSKKLVSFKLPADYNKEKTLVIDPFVTATTTLTGTNNGIAKDIDFDYAGNIFVSGGGDNGAQKLAKFSPTGTLLWTFSGTLGTPSWNFGSSYGGWMVDKVGGGVYIGQGLMSSGFAVVRLNAAGLYDNYITIPNVNFSENWKMTWSCNGGAPKLLIAGGGGSANNELALLSPPAVVPVTSNLSGLTGGHNDISDIVIDPVTNDMFTIYSTPAGSPGRDNFIYKHPPPYTSTVISWQVPTGYFALNEPRNRPYLTGLDNSSNTLAVNSSYLFYWDGVNLKAINKATGAAVGVQMNFSSNMILQQGGIHADECNNVFIGFTNGTIKVLKFNGTLFDDAAAADITITGFPANAVYDLAYDNAHELLYAGGNGFVASIDVSGYCPSPIYSLSVADDCLTLSATATVNPVPPSGTTVTFVLYNGTTELASNTSGVFTGLSTGINYTVRAFLNRDCGGTQTFTTFMFTNLPTLITHSPPAVCLPDGTADLTTAAITAGSAPGLIFSYWMDAAVTVPMTTPTAAIAGTYYIKGTPATGGCPAARAVTVPSLPVPVADAGADIAICFGDNTQLSGSGGVTYSWNPSTFLDNPTIANPRVINPTSGTHVYHLTITDPNGCRSLADEQVAVIVAAPPLIGIVRDTVVAINQPLQFNATDANNSGFISYVWTPSTGLNDPFIPNPIAILDRDITYIIKAKTISDCEGAAAVNVKVYQGPEVYVPTAFTPGGDGLNDILKVTSVGMKEFHFFNIYNRWGERVFTTSDPRNGWDGTIKGIPQASNTYVWMVEAVDYKGNKVFRKGTVTLIR
jgi:gliding motility-associated-like protein